MSRSAGSDSTCADLQSPPPSPFSIPSESDVGSDRPGPSQDQNIPANFQIPICWRSEIMPYIIAKEMPTPSIRSALVRDLVVHMYSYGSRPSKPLCKHVARQLVLKYPFLRDSIGTGYVSYFQFIYRLDNNILYIFVLIHTQGSWLQRITERVYNLEKGQKKRSASDDSEPTLPSGKKGRLVNRYPPVNEAEMLDEDVYQKHLKTLNNELEKSKPKKDVLIDLMAVTYSNRRTYILEQAESVQEIIEKFPAFLVYPEIVSHLFVSFIHHAIC